MRYWKRIVTFLLVFAMLASLVPPVAAESYETITLNQEKAIDLNKVSSVIFSFTPAAEGYYSFQSKDYDEDPKGWIYDSNMDQLYYDDGDDWNFDITWFARAGETYYLEAGGAGVYTACVVEKPQATSIELICDAETGYPDGSHYYNLGYQLLPEDCFYETVTFSSSDEQVVSVNDYGEYFMLSPGTAELTVTTASGLTDSCTVTVREPETVQCDETVTVYGEEQERRLLFTPETSGWYGFYSTGDDIDTAGRLLDAEGVELDFNDDGGEGHNFLVKAWLEAGNSYILQADWGSYFDDCTAQLHISALSAPEGMELNSTVFTGYVDATWQMYYSFTPALSRPEAVTFSSSDETVATVNETGYITVRGAGTAVITATSESGLTASCGVTGKEAPLVTCDDVIYRQGNDAFELYKFIPETSGVYCFYSFNAQGDPYGYILSENFSWDYGDDDNGVDMNFMVEAYLEAGEVYYLNPEWNGWGAEDHYEARILRKDAATGLALTYETLTKQVGDYESLNAWLVPMMAYISDVTWTSSDETVATVNDYGEVFCLSEGTAVITATSENGLTASCTVTVKDLEIIVCDEPVTVYEADEGCKLRFIPETSGWYGFYSTGNEMNTWGYIQDEDGNTLVYNDYNGHDNNFLARAWLEAGNSYVLCADWSNYENDYTAQLQVTALGVLESLVLSTSYFDDYVGRKYWMSCWSEPLLSIPEVLTWTSSDETVATVDENGCIIIQGAGTAVITATSESGLTASCTVLGRVAPLVTCDDVIVKYGYNDYELYKFIPETSGWYGFYSTGSQGDPYGCILNQWFDWLSNDDDNGIDDDFLVRAYLDAGEVYYLYPLWDSWSSSDSYEARIAPLTPATGLVLSDDSLSKQVGDDTRLEAVFTPLLSVSEAVTWSSSDESVATVDSDGWVNCLTEGTAVITVTSENGLTASCTVTVKDLETVVCDQSVTVYEEDESCRLRFIPETSGWYGFYSIDTELYPWGYFMDEYENNISQNVHYYDNNFVTKAWLEAGNSYILCSGWDNYNHGRTAQLQVTALSAPHDLELETTSLTHYQGGKYRLYHHFKPTLSIPETLTWTSSDESVVIVDDEGNMTIQGAGTAIVTATSESGLAASCTVTGKVASLVTCDDVIVKDSSNDYELYKFIPETSGWYGFYSFNADGDPCGSIRDQLFNWIDHNDDNGIDDNFMVKAYLDAGETYYLNPYWDDWNIGEHYEARIAPLEPSTGIALSQQELTKSVSSWVYLQAYTTPMLSIPEELTWSSSDESVATVNEFGEVFCLSEGTAVITVTAENGNQATCTLTVNAVPTIGLDQTVDINAADGESRHRFTAPQDGWYAFSSLNNTVDTVGTLYAENGGYLQSDDDGGDNNNFLIRYYLNEGQTCILVSRTWGDDLTEGSYQLQVTVCPEATGVMLSITKLQGFVDKTDYLYARLSPYGAAPQSMTWTSSDESVVLVDQEGYLEYVGVGTAVITVTTETGLTDSCTVTVKATRDINLGDSVTLNAQDGNQMFRFVPDTTGVYSFYSTGDQVDPWCEVLDQYNNQIEYDSDSGAGDNFCISPYLVAGETYYFAVYPSSGNLSDSYAVHLEQATTATDIQLSQTAISGQPGDQIPLTATLVPENAVPQELYWSTSDDTVAYMSGGYVVLANEGTAVITVTTDSGLTASCQVTVAFQQITSIQCDQPTTVYAANGTTLFHFVPETSGWYRFFSEGDADPYGAICDEVRNVLISSDDYTESTYNFSARYELTAGESYYLCVNFYGDDMDDSCTVTVTKMQPASGISLSYVQLQGYVGDGWCLYADVEPEFAAPEDITWTSSDESVVTVNEDGDLNYTGIGTAVITGTSENGLTATCTVTVIEPAQLYLNKTENMEASQQIYRFRFIPETTGWYGFHTVGDVGLWAMLNRENGDEVTETEGVNNMMKGYLQAGETYSLFYDIYAGEGTVTLTPIALAEPTELSFENDQLMFYPGMADYAYYFFQPYESYEENVTWSTADSAVAEVNEYGVVYAVAPGTTQITVTSESGLTDTLTVVVAELPVDADDYGRCGDNLLWQLKNGILTITGSGDMFDYWRPGPFGKLEMPEGLTSIGAYVFGNQNIGEVVIPSTVTLIDYGAFRDSSVACFHFKGNAPEVRNEAFYGVTTTAFYPAEDPTWTDEVRQNYGGNITWIPYYTDEPDEPVEPDVPEGSAGVTVSGSVTTFTEGDTTVELLLNGEVVCTVDVSGKTGTYSFDNVATGTYTLRISKATHVTREYELTVDTDSVTQDVKIHRIGDINGDGKITVADVSKAYAHVKKSTLLTDYEFLCADIISDGRISTADVSKAYAHAKKTTFLW